MSKINQQSEGLGKPQEKSHNCCTPDCFLAKEGTEEESGMNGELRVYVSLHMNDVSVKSKILPSATRLILALHSIIFFL